MASNNVQQKKQKFVKFAEMYFLHAIGVVVAPKNQEQTIDLQFLGFILCKYHVHIYSKG
jgi:hypothetical protein